jgi:hypothetical protein
MTAGRAEFGGRRSEDDAVLHRKTVLSVSCLRAISTTLASSAATCSGPLSRSTTRTLNVVSPGEAGAPPQELSEYDCAVCPDAAILAKNTFGERANAVLSTNSTT